jgi:hypothetical protein
MGRNRLAAPMSRWFRFYDDTINNPKALKLSDQLFRIWVGLLCIASKHEGVLPTIEDCAIMLRLKPERLEEAMRELALRALLDTDGTTWEPHDWNERQYKSDVSTTRVKRFRERQRNVSETPPDTEQSQIQNRNAAQGAQSQEKLFFDQAVQILGNDGRSLAAKLLKAKGSVLAAHQAMLTAAQKANPREYLGAIIRGREGLADRPDRSW